MAKKYFVWKDPACNGKDIEWIELTGREFYTMLKQPKNQTRYFIRLGNDICSEADVIFMEATEPQYIEWRKEQNAHAYIAGNNAIYETISLDYPFGEEEGVSLHEITIGKAAKVESSAVDSVLCEHLRDLLEQLTQDEYQLLMDIYANEKTTVQLAKERNVSQQSVSKRVKRLVRRLQKFF